MGELDYAAENRDYEDTEEPYRVCEICGITYHEEFGYSCRECDIWICNNCWPEHTKETEHHD